MATLEDTVNSVVEDFVKNGVLFTALDVSNAVKKTLPQARHREVRDAVRASFTSNIEVHGWAKTPIAVSLEDGSTAEAILYHPLMDSWDLDSKYDAQKRAQIPVHTTAAAPSYWGGALPPLSSTQKSVLSQVQGNNSAAVVTVPVAQGMTTPVVPTAPVPMPTARTLWDNLFKTQPSLFPGK